MNHYTWKNKQFKKLLLHKEILSQKKKVVIIIVTLSLCECMYVCVYVHSCAHVQNVCVCVCKHVCEYRHPHAMVNMWRSEDNTRCLSLSSAYLRQSLCLVICFFLIFMCMYVYVYVSAPCMCSYKWF